MRVKLIVLMLTVLVTTQAAANRGSGPSSDTPTPDCRPACEARCERTPCDGLNVAQCIHVRQSCRIRCSSRC